MSKARTAEQQATAENITFVVGPGGTLGVVIDRPHAHAQPIITQASRPLSHVPLRPGSARRA